MTAPLIAVVGYRLPEGRVTHWPWAAVAVPAQYVEAVRRAGGRPVILPPGEADAGATDALGAFDGLLLVGGGDVEPERYGAERHPNLYGVDGSRDEMELALVRGADRTGVPLLAICRGCQVVNVAFGGTLHQHIPDLPDTVQHGVPGGGEVLNQVSVEDPSVLARTCGASILAASCHHHQAIDRVGDGLTVSARAADGLIEAVERPEGFLLGVQWHPEDTAANDPAQQALFDALVAHAAGRRGRLRASSHA
jgi:putative glutamine amidotransferase